MNRNVKIVVLLTLFILLTALSVSTTGQSTSNDREATQARLPKIENKDENKRIKIGLDIAPVPLDFRKKDKDLVGLGSYIVNAQAACGDCHTCPTYAPGHNPFSGGDCALNAAHYLAGGVPFGPI